MHSARLADDSVGVLSGSETASAGWVTVVDDILGAACLEIGALAQPCAKRGLRLAEQRNFTHITAGTDADAYARAQAAAVIGGAQANEPPAVEIMHEIARWIGIGLVNTAAFLAPDVVVIGGGLGERSFELLERTVCETLQAHQGMVRTDFALRKAMAGDDAGLLGAAHWATFGDLEP